MPIDIASKPAKEAAFLGVESSLEGKKWLMQDVNDRLALAMAQRLQLPELVTRVMAARGVTLDHAKEFLNPTLRDLLPDPSNFIDMDRAAERIATAITQNEVIGIFGDYDVDGATSSALLRRFIKKLGGRTNLYIPDRIKEGYGPNAPALLKMASEGASLVLTVDCGTAAFGPLEAAHEAGLDIIVIDHHAVEPTLPVALAIINPNRMDDESGQGHLAAVGIVFLLVIAVNRVLRQKGFYNVSAEPDLMAWLDLVALGTVCDVVPLVGINRALVKQGLKVISRRANAGLAALSDVGGIDEKPGSYHLGFILGPRINAGGRVGSPALGSLLLTTENNVEAKQIAMQLDTLNGERRDIEQAVLSDALNQMQSEREAAGPVAFVASKGWHPGVIGIIASRLKDRFNRPACVIAISEDDGIATGSGRSVSGIDLGAAVIAAHQAGIIDKGGGHKMAAGFTFKPTRLDDFRNFLNDRVKIQIKEAGIVPTLRFDGSMTTSAASLQTAEQLEELAPFGSGNAEPRFVIPSAQIVYAERVGEDHVRCTLESAEGGHLAGICFRSTDRPLGQTLLSAKGRPMHVAGRLRVNSWRGRNSPQLLIDDAQPIW